ncbi:MAG: hypothetical protein QXI58_01090 [Candidatus Micrarchaeia archaeon]
MKVSGAIDRFFSVVDTLRNSSQINLKDITEEGDETIFIDENGFLIIQNKDYLIYARSAFLGDKSHDYLFVNVLNMNSKEPEIMESSIIKLDKPFKVNNILANEIEIKISFVSQLGDLPEILYSDLGAVYNDGTSFVHLAQLKYKENNYVRYFVPFVYWVGIDYMGMSPELWIEWFYDIFEDTYFLFDDIHGYEYEGVCVAVKLTRDSIIIEDPTYELERYFTGDILEILEELKLNRKKAEQLIITPSFMKVIIGSDEHTITSKSLEQNYKKLYKDILDSIRAPIVLKDV